MAGHSLAWEWIVVDDHSTDRTPQLIAELATKDGRVSGLRLSRTFGEHTAIYCGLSACRGSAAVAWIADADSAPELIGDLVSRWRDGAQVVWAQPKRSGGLSNPASFAMLYHRLLKRVLRNRQLPSEGVDHVLLDRRVIDSLKEMPEANFNIFALVAWLGFRQATVDYPAVRSTFRRRRSLRQMISLLISTVVSFSMFPVRLAAASGVIFATLGLMYVPVVVYNWWSGAPVTGWTELIVIILILGGLLMIQSSISGEYLWRTLGETRGRPRFIIEASYGFPDGGADLARRDLPSASVQ